MLYPVMITIEDLKNEGLDITDKSPKEIKRFIDVIHSTIYDFIIFSSLRNLRKRLISEYIKPEYNTDLKEQLKAILIDTAFAFDEQGEDLGLWNGETTIDNGSRETKDLQERLLAVVPPRAFNLILGLEPNVMFAGSEI